MAFKYIQKEERKLSLFKILRGDSSRIAMSITPFHDGFAYFAADNGGFYIDSDIDGVQRRTKINKLEIMSATQPANLHEGDDWDKVL